MTPIIPTPSYFFHSNSRHSGVKHLLACLVWVMGTGSPFVNQEHAYKALSINPVHSRAQEMQVIPLHLNKRESETDLESSAQKQECKAGCLRQNREAAGENGLSSSGACTCRRPMRGREADGRCPSAQHLQGLSGT